MEQKDDKNQLDLTVLERILASAEEGARGKEGAREDVGELPPSERPRRPPSRFPKIPAWVWVLGIVVVVNGCFLLALLGLQVGRSQINTPLPPTSAPVVVFSPEPTAVRFYCLDSDASEKPDDIYIKGEVVYLDQSGEERTLPDECTGSKTQVNEMWCYESPAGSGQWVPGRMVYDCPLGCFDGACNRQ